MPVFEKFYLTVEQRRGVFGVKTSSRDKNVYTVFAAHMNHWLIKLAACMNQSKPKSVLVFLS